MGLALVVDLPAGGDGEAVMDRLAAMALRGEASLVLSARDAATGARVVVVRMADAAAAAVLTGWLATRPGGAAARVRTLLPDGEVQAGLGALFP